MSAVDVEQVKEALKAAFDKVDADNDGKVSHDDLKAVLQEAGFDGNDENIEAIIARADSNEDGVLDFEEFATAVIAVGIAIRVMMFLRRAFAALDTDGSGYITPDNLREMVKSADLEGVTDEDIDDLIAAADTSGDGKVSFEEFATAIGKRLEEQD